MGERILVVAAHADDEALGCGGALALHAEAGGEVAVLFLTNGVGARGAGRDREIERRRNASADALGVLGCTRFETLDFPDNAMDSVPLLEVARAIEGFCASWGQPTRVYTHHEGDLNVDHRIARSATLTCFRPQPPAAGQPQAILSFEVASSTGWAGTAGGFHPTFFVDVSSVLDRKLSALRAYAEEMRRWPHARSIRAVEALARFRGSTVGVEAAEAFVTERILMTSTNFP